MTSVEQFSLWCLDRKSYVVSCDVDWLARQYGFVLAFGESIAALKELEKQGLVEMRKKRNKHSTAPLPFFFPYVLTESGRKQARRLPYDPQEILLERLAEAMAEKK